MRFHKLKYTITILLNKTNLKTNNMLIKPIPFTFLSPKQFPMGLMELYIQENAQYCSYIALLS